MVNFLEPNFLASGGILFAFDKSTIAGKLVIMALMMGSIVSWSVIISKTRQLDLARRQTARFLKKFRSSRSACCPTSLAIADSTPAIAVGGIRSAWARRAAVVSSISLEPTKW